MFDLYENIKAIAAFHGYTPSGLCEAMHMSKSVMSNLRNRRVETLSAATLHSIADFLGEPYDIVAHGIKKDPADMSIDEVDAEVAEIYETIKDDEPMRVLFHAAKRATPEQRRAAIAMLKSFENNQ